MFKDVNDYALECVEDLLNNTFDILLKECVTFFDYRHPSKIEVFNRTQDYTLYIKKGAKCTLKILDGLGETSDPIDLPLEKVEYLFSAILRHHRLRKAKAVVREELGYEAGELVALVVNKHEEMMSNSFGDRYE